MKISDANGSVMRGISARKVEKSKVKGAAFQKVMNHVVDQGGGKSVKPSHVNPPETSLHVSPARLIGSMEGHYGVSSGAKVMRDVESALDLAGFYSKKLGDPGIKAASLEPLVDYLEEKMKAIRFLRDHENLDEEMKAIISDLDLVVGTEVARFRRGDYS